MQKYFWNFLKYQFHLFLPVVSGKFEKYCLLRKDVIHKCQHDNRSCLSSFELIKLVENDFIEN